MTMFNRPITCPHCEGSGHHWRHDPQHDDPELRTETRETCRTCKGSGNQPCEDCGDTDAVTEYADPRNPRNKFMVCKECFDEWTTEDNEP